MVEKSNAALDIDTGMSSIKLIGPMDSTELIEAVSASPTINRTLEGAATLTISLTDTDRKILRSGILGVKNYAVVGSLRFVYVNWDKSENGCTLTFEDAVVNKLRNHTAAMLWNTGSTTVQQIAREIAQSAQVLIEIDPTDRGVVNEAVDKKEGEPSWDLLKSLAEARNWRCFSDGWRIMFGSDEWLATLTEPVTLRETAADSNDLNPVYNIDLTCDVATPAHTASAKVEANQWALPPGRMVTLTDLGWGDGVWMVVSFERTLTNPLGTVEFTRRRIPLPEPPPEQTQTPGESGEDGFDTLDSSVVDIDVDLQRLRQCESTSNYKINTGNGFYGAYQFDKKTWQGLGYSGLPHEASPATQDEAATKLYQQRGWQPWPSCSKKLGLVDKRNSGASSAAAKGGTAPRQNMIDIALRFAKQSPKYIWGGKTARGYDCSGFIAAVTKEAGKQLSGGSKQQKSTCEKQGKLISVAQGLKTPGAILFRMSGNPTHVAMSLGDGRTVEARGSADGTGVFGNANSRTWTHAAIWI